MANTNRGNLLSRVLGLAQPGPAKVNPMREAGVSGTPIYAGYVRPTDIDAKLVGQQRYRTAADILTNCSVVAAGVRYFLNLCAKPAWKVVPADDTAPAREIADFVEEVLFGMGSSWSRVIRRSGMFRYHGFGINEWTAIKRDDGRIGFKDIESRPQFTIWQWATDESGEIQGVWQRSPQTGERIWIPRSKFVYMVDDMMTDSPEGMGWFRGLADPYFRLKRYLELEVTGFERNLAGVPIGRIPYAEIKNAVESSKVTQADANAVIKQMEDFVSMQAKNQATSLVLDSVPYESITADGTTVSSVYKYGVDILKGDASGMAELGKSIDRDIHQMARIIGVESLLIVGGGQGSRALAKVEAENISLVINSTITDMAQAYDRDAIGAIMSLNAIPDKLRPTLSAEDVAFKDVEQMAAVILSMANAGAMLDPQDPAINELRGLMGLSDQPKMDPAQAAQVDGMGTGPGGRGVAPSAKAPQKNEAAPDPNAADAADRTTNVEAAGVPE